MGHPFVSDGDDAVLALLQGLLLALQTSEHRHYGRSRMVHPGRRRPTGHVAVFAPCKGLDVDLEANLHALLRQDYDDYDVTFIVQSADDPACEVIRRVTAAHCEVPSRVVVAHAAMAAFSTISSTSRMPSL